MENSTATGESANGWELWKRIVDGGSICLEVAERHGWGLPAVDSNDGVVALDGEAEEGGIHCHIEVATLRGFVNDEMAGWQCIAHFL